MDGNKFLDFNFSILKNMTSLLALVWCQELIRWLMIVLSCNSLHPWHYKTTVFVWMWVHCSPKWYCNKHVKAVSYSLPICQRRQSIIEYCVVVDGSRVAAWSALKFRRDLLHLRLCHPTGKCYFETRGEGQGLDFVLFIFSTYFSFHPYFIYDC